MADESKHHEMVAENLKNSGVSCNSDDLAAVASMTKRQRIAATRWIRLAWQDGWASNNKSRLTPTENAAQELLEALKLAQRWLVNSMPLGELDGPKPLPIIAAAIAKAESTPAPTAG